MIEILVGAGTLAVVAGAIYLGAKAGFAANPPTISGPGATSTANCQQACAAWDSARQMQCIAKANESAARSRADGIRADMGAFIVSGGLLAAAAAATFALAVAAASSIFGIAFAIKLRATAVGLASAAAVAAASAAYLAGQLVAAESDYTTKANARSAWDIEVARLLAAINTQCSAQEVSACLSKPPPC